jgi:hypothetical protein
MAAIWCDEVGLSRYHSVAPSLAPQAISVRPSGAKMASRRPEARLVVIVCWSAGRVGSLTQNLQRLAPGQRDGGEDLPGERGDDEPSTWPPEVDPADPTV